MNAYELLALSKVPHTKEDKQVIRTKNGQVYEAGRVGVEGDQMFVYGRRVVNGRGEIAKRSTRIKANDVGEILWAHDREVA